MSSPNVLHVNCAQEQTALLEASHEVVRQLIADHNLTLIDLAERVDCTVQTISNAFNKKHVLSQAIQTRIGKLFGPHALDPMARIYGARNVPLESVATRDILPLVGRVNLAIAEARDPQSPGGEREVLQEKLGYLAHLRTLQRELEATICGIEAERDRVMGRAAA